MEAWNADGKELSIWDVYADTLGKIKNEDTGDVANGRFHRYSRMLRCKIESPRSSRNGGLSWQPAGVGLAREGCPLAARRLSRRQPRT